jgi:CRP-like cAMP-binding protein
MVSVIAATDTRLLKLPGNAIHRLLEDRPEFWRAFYQLSARNLMTAVTLLSESLALTVRARVCRRLLSLSPPTGAARLTQADLARVLGISRPTLRRCLDELVAQRAIQIMYGKVLVLNRAILETFRDEQ